MTYKPFYDNVNLKVTSVAPTNVTSSLAKPTEGIKYDQAKPKMHLVDAYWYQDVAQVLTIGEKKYSSYNWTKITERSRVISSLERHLQEIKKGNYVDSESGLSHTAHIAANSMFLHYFERAEVDNDDLFYPNKKNTKE